MTKPKSKITQLRLLLPAEWLSELDQLAATRFLTRLGLIRFYLRSQMNDDLANLAEHFKQTQEQRKTLKTIQQRRQDKEW